MQARFLEVGMLQMMLACSGLAAAPEVIRTNPVPVPEPIKMVAFSPDGSLLGSGGSSGDPVFRRWSAATMVTLGPYYSQVREGWRPTSISFAADNSLAAFGVLSGRGGMVVDGRSGLLLLQISSEDSGPCVANVLAVSPLNTNPRVLLNAGFHGIQKRSVFFAGTNVSSISAPTALPVPYQPGNSTALTFLPDGTRFLHGNDSGTVQLFQIDPPQLLWQTNFPNQRVLAINVFSNSPPIVTLASNQVEVLYDDAWKTVRLWALGATNWLQVFQPDWPVLSSTLTPDGQAVFLVLARLWDRPAYWYTNAISLWRVRDGRLLTRYEDQVLEVKQVAVAPDGQTFAYGRADGVLVLARMPVVVTQAEKRAEGFNFDWQGGSGLYQVQTTSNVVQGPWTDFGPPTTNTSLTVPTTNPAAFFRLQSLTNAP